MYVLPGLEKILAVITEERERQRTYTWTNLAPMSVGVFLREHINIDEVVCTTEINFIDKTSVTRVNQSAQDYICHLTNIGPEEFEVLASIPEEYWSTFPEQGYELPKSK